MKSLFTVYCLHVYTWYIIKQQKHTVDVQSLLASSSEDLAHLVVLLLLSPSFTKLKSFTLPAVMYSASLHPGKECFVAGGEDFKLYKFDCEVGKELGEQNNLTWAVT